MAGSTEFEKFLAQRLKENQGVLVPVKASLFELMFVKKADCRRLHPNPEDEFCDPNIGPNYEIIGKYAEKIARTGSFGGEPLVVQKVNPDGYMLLNGHHRWAAALRTGYNPVPISIVNLTQEKDIERMIRNSRHDKRVTLDLDEVAFCEADGMPAERPLHFPYNKLYKERIRLGIPALLLYLGRQGYDIWVYTAQYYSIEYIRAYFKHYSVKVDGIVTGTALKRSESAQTAKLIANQYAETLHIDNDLVLRTWQDSKDFEEYPIEAGPADWSRTVMEIVKRLDRGGEKR